MLRPVSVSGGIVEERDLKAPRSFVFLDAGFPHLVESDHHFADDISLELFSRTVADTDGGRVLVAGQMVELIFRQMSLGPGVSTDEARRLLELEQENRELRRANEILKRAASFFGAEPGRHHKK